MCATVPSMPVVLMVPLTDLSAEIVNDPVPDAHVDTGGVSSAPVKLTFKSAAKTDPTNVRKAAEAASMRMRRLSKNVLISNSREFVCGDIHGGRVVAIDPASIAPAAPVFIVWPGRGGWASPRPPDSRPGRRDAKAAPDLDNRLLRCVNAPAQSRRHARRIPNKNDRTTPESRTSQRLPNFLGGSGAEAGPPSRSKRRLP